MPFRARLRRRPYYVGDLKRDPSLENYSYRNQKIRNPIKVGLLGLTGRDGLQSCGVSGRRFGELKSGVWIFFDLGRLGCV